MYKKREPKLGKIKKRVETREHARGIEIIIYNWTMLDS
jgi:hypothetical protein